MALASAHADHTALARVRTYNQRMGLLFSSFVRRATLSKQELLGSEGIVCSVLLDTQHGEVRVRNAQGDELIVHGRTRQDVLLRDTPVVLVDYDQARDVFLVADFSVAKGAL